MPLSWSFRKTSNKNGYSCCTYWCFIAIQLIKNICSLALLNLSVVSRIGFNKKQQILKFALNDILHCFAIFCDKSRYLRIDTSHLRWKTVAQNISRNITICVWANWKQSLVKIFKHYLFFHSEDWVILVTATQIF